MVGLTRREIVSALDASRRLVTLDGTVSLTLQAHANKTLLMGAAGAALTFTLPEAQGLGARYRFVVSVVNTSNYIINVAGAADTMDGFVHMHQDSATTALFFQTVAASDTVTLNGTSTGGVAIGDFLDFEDIASGQWIVNGVLTGSGGEATPFSEAVS